MNRSRAVFLDRDGVLNEAIVRDGKPYPPSTLAEVKILAGAPDAIRELRLRGYLLIAVTNQPDVARGLTLRETVEEINQALADQLQLDDIIACYEDGDHPCKKPNPGMLLEAADKHNIDLSSSWMIGDRWRDVEAGRRAGCRNVFFDYGYAEKRPDPPADICCSGWHELMSRLWNECADSPAPQQTLNGLRFDIMDVLTRKEAARGHMA